MAAGRIVLSQYFPARDRNARLVSGAKLYVYLNGTTTKATIYSDEAMTTTQANPVEANSSGQFPAIWASDATTYTLSITGPDGESIGNPSVFNDYSVSTLANTESVALAEAASTAAQDYYADILALAGDYPDPAALATRAAKASNLSDLSDKEAATNNLLFLQSVTGAASRSVRNKLRDVVSAKDLDCAVDGSTNDSTAFSAAITNATGRTIVVPAGASMKLNSAIANTTTNVSIVGEPGAVLDLSGGGSILLNPGVTALPNLSADITAGGYTATFASAHGLSEGDVFIVSNPTGYSFNDWRAEYNDGRMFKVAAVVSTTQVRFYGLSPRTFASGSVGCYKLNGGTLRLENIDIIPPNATGSQIEFDGFSRVFMKNVRARRSGTTNDYAIFLNRCYESHIEAPQGTVLNGVGLAYPIVVSSCQKGVISDLSGTYSTRHALAFGGRVQTANTPTGVFVINGVIAENDYVNNIGAIDVHGDCEEVQYLGGITHGIVCSGRNTRISNMRVIGAPDVTGTAIVGSELSQGYQVYENLEIETWGNGSADGIIKIDLSKRNGPVDIIFRNITIKANNPVTRLFQFVAGSASPPAYAVRIILDGIHIASTSAIGQLVYVSGINDVSTTFSGDIRNVTGAITSGLETDLGANLKIPFVWNIQKKGVLTHGDNAYTINPRSDVDTHVYSGADLTVARTIALLNNGTAVVGDRVKVVRTVAGAGDLFFNIAVEEVTLLQNQSAEAVFVRDSAGAARWYFTEKSARI